MHSNHSKRTKKLERRFWKGNMRELSLSTFAHAILNCSNYIFMRIYFYKRLAEFTINPTNLSQRLVQSVRLWLNVQLKKYS